MVPTRLIDALNALGWLADPDFKPVEVLSVLGEDGSTTVLVFAADTVIVGQRAGVQITDPATFACGSVGSLGEGRRCIR